MAVSPSVRINVSGGRGARGATGADNIEISQVLGVPAGSLNLGTFTGDLIPDNSSVKGAIQGISDNLGSSGGADLIGTDQGLLSNKLAQFTPAIPDTPFSAVEGRNTVNAIPNEAAVNAAIATGARQIIVPRGDWVIANQPDNIAGAEYEGAGKLLVADPEGGFHQINTYADRGIVVGRETLTRAYSRIALGPPGATSALNVFCYGDSTVEGYVAPPATRNGHFLPQVILPRLFRQEGIHNVRVTNRGVSGTSWPDLNAIPDIGAGTDLFIIKYGINDRALAPAGTPAQKLAQMAANMDVKLSAIRSSIYGGINQLSIILVGPNSTKDQTNGRNEEWYEEVRRLYVHMARKYGCCYFDTYEYLRDARKSGPFWLDSGTAGSETIHIHPLDAAAQWIWGGIVRLCFPRQEHSFWGANNFTVIGSEGTPPLASKTPADYAHGYYGETWEFATVANGFPAEGILKTSLNPDNFAFQELVPLAASGRVFRRFGANASAWAAFWTGAPVAIALSNGWIAGAGPDSSPYAVRSDDGIVMLGGVISGGATGINTMLATLPEFYRPSGYEYFTCASSSATPILVRVDPDGKIYCLTAADATRTSFAGISFKAA